MDETPRVVYLSNTALFAALLTVETWLLTIYSFFGDKDPTKKVICVAISVAATLFLQTAGRKALGGVWPVKRGQHIGITAMQACWVTPLVIGIGVFYQWVLG